MIWSLTSFSIELEWQLPFLTSPQKCRLNTYKVSTIKDLSNKSHGILRQNSNITRIFTKQSDTPQHQAPSVSPGCTRNGKGFFAFPNTTTGIHARWCPTSCKQMNINDPRFLQMLRNTSIYFVGNSHLRNMFRCAADIITNEDSWRYAITKDLADTCHKASSTKYTMLVDDEAAKPAHKLSCNNVERGQTDSEYHIVDYNITLHHMWVVFWQMLAELRIECLGGDKYPSATDVRECILPKLVDKNDQGKLKEYRDYVNVRLGFDLLRSELLETFQINPDAYLIMNYHEIGANAQYITWLGEVMDLGKDINGMSLKDRTIFLVDPHYEYQDATMLEDLEKSGFTILEMRHVWKDYRDTKHPDDVNGDGWNGNMHIGNVFQRILVAHVLNLIAIKRSADPELIQELLDKPHPECIEPHLISN